MSLSRIACTAVLSGIAVMPAAAADLSGRYMVHRPRPQPFYLVNQGPVLSGPGISIVWIGLTKTGLRRSYPYIRSYPHIGMSHFGRPVVRARY